MTNFMPDTWYGEVFDTNNRPVRLDTIEKFYPARGYGFLQDRTYFHIGNKVIPTVVQTGMVVPQKNSMLVTEESMAPLGAEVVYEAVQADRGPKAFRWALVSDIYTAQTVLDELPKYHFVRTYSSGKVIKSRLTSNIPDLVRSTQNFLADNRDDTCHIETPDGIIVSIDDVRTAWTELEEKARGRR